MILKSEEAEHEAEQCQEWREGLGGVQCPLCKRKVGEEGSGVDEVLRQHLVVEGCKMNKRGH